MIYLWKGEEYKSSGPLPDDLRAAMGTSVSPTLETLNLSDVAPLPASGDGLLLINTAEKPDEITVLPSIRIASAQQIFTAREVAGEFATLEEVKAATTLPRADWDAIASWVAD